MALYLKNHAYQGLSGYSGFSGYSKSRLPKYGVFSDTTDQTFAANTATAITFNTTEENSGVTIGSPTSRIVVDEGGLYNIQFSAQLVHTAGGIENISIWLRKNGTDVVRTNTEVAIQGNDTELVAAWNLMLTLAANDYIELMLSATDSDIRLEYIAAQTAPTRPVTPSIILTIIQATNVQEYRLNIDGGVANSIYTPDQVIDGGGA